MKIDNWHVFTLEKEAYLYNCTSKQAVQIETDFARLLEQKNAATWKTVENMFDGFEVIEEQPLRRNYYDLFLLISNDCNAKCVYCFADQGCYGKKAGIMDVATAKRAIDFFIENIPDEAQASITFFGGEPLLATQTIMKTIEYLKIKYSSRKLTLSITTNGFLLTPEIVRCFAENNVNISLSIDGGKTIQNQQRPMKNRGNSFAEATKMLDEMRRMRLPVIARGTYFDYNIDLARVYNELLLLQFDGIQIVPDFLHVDSIEEVRKLERQVDSLYNYCVYYMKNILRDYSKFPFVPVIQQMRMLFLPPYSYSYACEKGKTLMAIDYVGNVFPCHRLSSDKDKIVANIFENTKYMWESDEIIPELGKNEKCTHCWNRYTCSHGCSHNTDSFAKIAFCAYSKKLTEVAIAILSKLSPEQVAKVIRL